MGLSNAVRSQTNLITAPFKRLMNVERTPWLPSLILTTHRRTTRYQTEETASLKAFREFLAFERPTLAVLCVLHNGEVTVHAIRRRAFSRNDVLGAFSLCLFMGPKQTAVLSDDRRSRPAPLRRWIEELHTQYAHIDHHSFAYFGLTDHGFYRKGDVGILMEAMHAYACGKDTSCIFV